MTETRIIDMSKLPAPQVIHVVDYEVILLEMIADFLQAYPDAADAIALESDPLRIWFERIAYEKMLLLQRANEDALAVMLPYATGADLDNLGAIFQVQRHILVPADATTTPPTPAVMEDDDAFRKRIQMAPQGFSVAGPIGAYRYHTLSADARVLDAGITSPIPGQVLVTVLSREGNGNAATDLLDNVSAVLNAETIRPLTDEVIVQSAQIIAYTITAKIFTDDGPDTTVVMQAVQQSIEAYVKEARAIGISVPLSGIYAALHISGVARVELIEPAAGIEIGDTQAPFCSAISLTQASTFTSN